MPYTVHRSQYRHGRRWFYAVAMFFALQKTRVEQDTRMYTAQQYSPHTWYSLRFNREKINSTVAVCKN